MSLSAVITPAVLDKVLGELATHFLPSAGGDLPTARQAASRLLAVHEVQTKEELRLAADIVSFSVQALDALDRSMVPGLTENEILRLRAAAANLSRQSERSQRRLDQLKCDRHAIAAQAELLAAADIIVTREAAGLIASARQALANGTLAPDESRRDGRQVWPRAEMRRSAARRIAEAFARKKTKLIREEAFVMAG
jgi:hypothetical protein